MNTLLFLLDKYAYKKTQKNTHKEQEKIIALPIELVLGFNPRKKACQIFICSS